MWLPHEHATPVAGASVLAALIPTATHAGFDDGVHGVDLTDLVHRERPPGGHLFREDLPRHLLRRLHVQNPADAVWIKPARHDLLRHYDLLAFVAARSAASLKASSVSSQNSSSHPRIAAIPRLSTR